MSCIFALRAAICRSSLRVFQIDSDQLAFSSCHCIAGAMQGQSNASCTLSKGCKPPAEQPGTNEADDVPGWAHEMARVTLQVWTVILCTHQRGVHSPAGCFSQHVLQAFLDAPLLDTSLGFDELFSSHDN